MDDRSTRPGLGLAALISVLTVYRLTTIGLLPLSPDEAYYWAWSRRLAWCYYDQPGMVAWLDRLFALGRETSTIFSVRLGAVVLSAISTYLAYRLYVDYRDDRKEALVFAGLFSLMPFSWLLGLIMIHDSALMPWLLLAYWAMIRLAKHDGRARDWFMLGLGLTGAMYAKFSAAMVVWGLLLFMVASPRARRWFWTWPPYVVGAGAAALYAPVIWWNYRHDWVSQKAVAELTAIKDLTLADRLEFMLEYPLSQLGMFAGLVGLLVLAAFIKGLRQTVRDRENNEVLLPVCLALPILLYFLQLSTRSHVYGNWPGVAYLPLALLGMREAALAWRAGQEGGLFGRKFAKTAVAVNLILVLLFTLHFQARLFAPALRRLEQTYKLDQRIDWRLDQDFGGWTEMGELGRKHGADADFLLARRYQVASMLEFMVPGQPRVECHNVGQRGNQWDLWSTLAQRGGQTALFIDIKPPPSSLLESFERVETIVSPLVVGDPERPIKRWHVFKLYGFKPDAKNRP